MDINNQIRHLNLRESRRKLVSLEIARRKRTEINDLINKELRIKNGAQNLLSVCKNSQSEQRLKLELTFVDSKIKYLKDQLAELNCDWTLFKMKNIASNRLTTKNINDNQKITTQQQNMSKSSFISSASSSGSSFESPTISGSSFITNSLPPRTQSPPIKSPHVINKQLNELSIWPSNEETRIQCELTTTITTESNSSDSFSPSSDSSSALTLTPIDVTSKLLEKCKIEDVPDTLMRSFNFEVSKSTKKKFILEQNHQKSADLMIYLSLKETNNNMDFSVGFKNFIWAHYREEPCNYIEQIRQFNYFRESTIKQSYEPSMSSIQRLFEYFNSLQLIERRFFQNSQCGHVFFTWYDSINGVESTQKSIQFEKASILFNCATLYTQLAAICCDGNEQKHEEQMIYWQKAAGCLKFLTTNFSNSPSFDMSSILLNIFIETFACQAYEMKTKMLVINVSQSIEFSPIKKFCTYLTCARLYSHISNNYTSILTKLETNACVKSYLPEIWFYLIKVKATHYRGLAHYFAALGLTISEMSELWGNQVAEVLFETLHDRKKFCSYFMKNPCMKNMGRLTEEQEIIYGRMALRNRNRVDLARAHVREAVACQEEALRQHSFCRKFSTDDYLHHLLEYYHESSLEKLEVLEKEKSNDFDDDMFDLLPISSELNESMILEPIEPNFHRYEIKEFFNLIGPLKIYSSELELSVPFSFMLKKHPDQRTFGITVKGDCPVRINHVDPASYAFSIGIREGSYIIAIQDHDVRWLRHNQVVERIRSYSHAIKLTVVCARELTREFYTPCENEDPKTTSANMEDELESIKMNNVDVLPSLNGKTTYSDFLNKSANHQNDSYLSKKFISLIEQTTTPKTSIRKRLFKNSKLSGFATNGPVVVPPIMENKINTPSILDAANRLYNLAKNTTSTVNLSVTEVGSTPTLRSFKRSMINLNSTVPIQFNLEDDEIANKENVQFLKNLKSLKTPFTNTITLGRKFKRNVLKLSIFNSLSGSNSNLSNGGDKIGSETVGGDKTVTEHVTADSVIKQNLSCSKNKQLKKKKKLEKTTMEIFKKMAAEKEKMEASSCQLQNKRSFIYKTL